MKKEINCSICGFVIEDEPQTIADETVCSSCYENNTACDECGCIVDWSDTTETPSGDFLCDDCFGQHYNHCYDCSDVISADFTYSDNYGDAYCEACYYDRYSHCHDCGDEIHRDDAYYDDDYPYCDSCYNERRSIHNYGYQPNPKFEKMPYENTVYLGVELEVENTHKDRSDAASSLKRVFEGDERVYIKEDGSVDYGYEVVTHPSTLLIHKKYGWRKKLDEMKKADLVGYDASSSCGLHIHINKSSFIFKNDENKLWFFINKIPKEKFMSFTQRSRGQIDNWCKQESTKYLSNKYGFLSCFNDRSRYTAVNRTSKTIELRMFRSTLFFDRFWSSLIFADAVVYFVSDYSSVFFIKRDGMEIWQEFKQWLKRKNEYKFLRDYLNKKNI